MAVRILYMRETIRQNPLCGVLIISGIVWEGYRAGGAVRMYSDDYVCDAGNRVWTGHVVV